MLFSVHFQKPKNKYRLQGIILLPNHFARRLLFHHCNIWAGDNSNDMSVSISVFMD